MSCYNLYIACTGSFTRVYVASCMLYGRAGAYGFGDRPLWLETITVSCLIIDTHVHDLSQPGTCDSYRVRVPRADTLRTGRALNADNLRTNRGLSADTLRMGRALNADKLQTNKGLSADKLRTNRGPNCGQTADNEGPNCGQ